MKQALNLFSIILAILGFSMVMFISVQIGIGLFLILWGYNLYLKVKGGDY